MHHLERSFAGRPFRLEAGRLAKQAAGSALLQFGETVVLAAVTVSDNRSPLDFFPLTVEYREKTYAAGKIPGGFLKREGRPSDDEILAARLIDRSLRPLLRCKTTYKSAQFASGHKIRASRISSHQLSDITPESPCRYRCTACMVGRPTLLVSLSIRPLLIPGDARR